MKGLVLLIVPFLGFLVTVHAASSGYSGTRGYAERSGTSNSLDKDKGYKIVIKLDDAFGQAAEDLELVKEVAVDMKLIKVLLEDIVPDIKEIRKFVPQVQALNEVFPGLRDQRQLRNGSRLITTQNASQIRTENLWEISVPKANCAELRLRGNKNSAVYSIQPDQYRNAMEVYCDMETDGGGWTTIQRRGVLNVPKVVREDFYRNWNDYENGFGIAQSDYWLGLENIYSLTKDCNNELIVNITSWDGVSKFARYTKFNITGKSDYYRLFISGYSGNAGDGLIHHNKMRFTTYDQQNDLNGDENCAQLYHGAWWYKDCFWSNLNGEYAEDGASGKIPTRNGIEWFSRHFYSNMKTEMKIRPKC